MTCSWLHSLRCWSLLKTRGGSLFVFVDELDRCRPNYAIEILENIKHIFEVPGVNYIVSTDRNQLAHSIKAIYGEGFDSVFYLRRFFDRMISLPEISGEGLSSLLLEEAFEGRRPDYVIPIGLEDNELTLESFFAIVCDVFSLPPRCQRQVAHEFEACCSIFSAIKKRCHPVFVLVLLCLKASSDKANIWSDLVRRGPGEFRIDGFADELKSKRIYFTGIGETSSGWPEQKKMDCSLYDVFSVYATLCANQSISIKSSFFHERIIESMRKERVLDVSNGGKAKGDIRYMFEVVVSASSISPYQAL